MSALASLCCVANEYLFETRVPNSTLYLSLSDNHVEPNILYLFPCLLFTMQTAPGFFYMFGKTLEEQNLVYCVGKIQLLVLIIRCCLKPVGFGPKKNLKLTITFLLLLKRQIYSDFQQM